MGAILANAIVTGELRISYSIQLIQFKWTISGFVATMKFDSETNERQNITDRYYYIEMGFTFFFGVEGLFKIWCLGPIGYVSQTIHKFELLLIIGTFIHLIPSLYLSGFTYFQVGLDCLVQRLCPVP